MRPREKGEQCCRGRRVQWGIESHLKNRKEKRGGVTPGKKGQGGTIRARGYRLNAEKKEKKPFKGRT